MTRAFELSVKFRKRGDRYAIASIALSFAASLFGFATAVTNYAWVGVVPGVFGAAGGAIASWIQRGHLDDLAASNRQLYKALQREIREYDAKVARYCDDPAAGAVENDGARFRSFVNRCEQASEDAQDAAEHALTRSTDR